MGFAQQFRALFEHLPDVAFFAKDAEGRFIAASRQTLERAGLAREEELLGRDDAAIHPPNVVRAVRADDLEVMRTRRPLVDRVETLFTVTNAKDWFLTTKVPIIDEQGEVIGIMGHVRPFHGGRGVADENPQLRRVVEHIQAHFQEPMVVEEMAKVASLSVRQLGRHFQRVFRMSPQEFLVRMRIQAAVAALIETSTTIADIATQHGFCDQSAFTRHFGRHVGETPRIFRQKRMRFADEALCAK